jgi:hypothetical protein
MAAKQFVETTVHVSIPFDEWDQALDAATECLESLPVAVAQLRKHSGQSRVAFIDALPGILTESRLAVIENAPVECKLTVAEARILLELLRRSYVPTLEDTADEEEGF